MRHFFLINQISKLNIKKDSSLFMALSFQNEGEEVYLVLENDFAITNNLLAEVTAYTFSGIFKEDSFYLSAFVLEKKVILTMKSGDIWHMRLDPPFDETYLAYLWQLQILEQQGARVLNSPRSILQNNEKIFPCFNDTNAIATWVGRDFTVAQPFLEKLLEEGYSSVVCKPLNLFAGQGVVKFSLNNKENLKAFCDEQTSPFMIQAFMKEVIEGEKRVLFWDKTFLGAIEKIPPQGDFVSNIAHGASFRICDLLDEELLSCQKMAELLSARGASFIAFDLLAGHINEANLTCPGLLVEVSEAHQQNLARLILEQII